MKEKKHKKACHFTKTDTNLYLKRLIRIPVEIIKLEDNSFHMLVHVETDGVQGDMIIDTGASVTVLDSLLFPEKTSASVKPLS